jgi:hypothetical protein
MVNNRTIKLRVVISLDGQEVAHDVSDRILRPWEQHAVGAVNQMSLHLQKLSGLLQTLALSPNTAPKYRRPPEQDCLPSFDGSILDNVSRALLRMRLPPAPGAPTAERCDCVHGQRALPNPIIPDIACLKCNQTGAVIRWPMEKT